MLVQDLIALEDEVKELLSSQNKQSGFSRETSADFTHATKWCLAHGTPLKDKADLENWISEVTRRRCAIIHTLVTIHKLKGPISAYIYPKGTGCWAACALGKPS